jgi:exopolysaccharide biosynthesis WecB/TagA/CpsF family protein
MVEDCLGARQGNAPKLIFDINGQALAIARTNLEYRKALQKADIVHADGQAIVMASQLFTKTPIPERSATTDMFHDAALVASKHKIRFFFLGATEAVNQQCAATMQAHYPNLLIAGRHHGYISSEDEDRICKLINSANVDVLWVGLGKPLEQEFCIRNASRLKAGWIITCGGCFNFVSGEYSRAPKWMQSTGFEWLYRAATRPKQFLWRYLTTNPVAIYMLLTGIRSGRRTFL